MWRWLLAKVPKRYRLWFKLILFSAGFHGIMLFLLLFLHKGSTSIYSFDLSRIAIDSDATIVFMPLHKTLSNNQVNKKGGKGAQKSAAQKAEPKIEKKSKAKNEKAPTTLASEKTRKKEQKQKESKNNAQKKQPKKVVQEKKVAEEKEIKKPADIEKPAEIENKTQQEAMGDGSNIVYVGREDLEALQLQQAICSEISEHWRPPRGVSKEKACIVRMLVDWQGAVKSITVEKPSGIAMYDVSVRKALLSMTVPQAAWGKELSITFKQV